jgi:SAM-dependent methyltransferase
MLKMESTQRFSSRVQDYVRCRPSYPREIVGLLSSECELTPQSVVADVASGTGLFTQLLLENGNQVFAVEPNADMRSAGENYLAAYPKLASIAGTAEATTLPDHSVDLVTSAQAAHWFDRERSLKEFARILKPKRFLVLIWNIRLAVSPFGHDYEEILLEYGTDYGEVKRRDEQTGMFFGSIPSEKRVLDNYQEFDYESLQGRLMSSSYTPQPGDPAHLPMLKDLRRLFDTYQRGGRVRMEYETRVYFGRLGREGVLNVQ